MADVLVQERAWAVSARKALFDLLEQLPLPKRREPVRGCGPMTRQPPGEFREATAGEAAAADLGAVRGGGRHHAGRRFERRERPWIMSPLRLAAHAQMHAFRHRGVMARSLGHPPQDGLGSLFL